jgi:hypothetical protein
MSAPSAGASVAFADPRLKAEQALPVWLPEAGAARLRFTACPGGDAHGDRPGVRVSGLPNVEHVLLDAAGRQHVVLRSGASAMQLLISGGDAIVGPVVLGVCLSKRQEIGTAAKDLSALEGVLCAPNTPRSGVPGWTAQSLRLRDALVALDGHRAGATLRETASLIYGRERIGRDWPDAGLRQRLRRDLQRGQALCAGGYRDLIR